MLANPVFVPAVQRDFLWDQVVDAVDDYFKIEVEERVREYEGVVVEGRIDTFPVVGSTALEPWRGDSTPGYERLQATLQSVRRHAHVRVIPASGGYLVDVQVMKELEDRDRPDNSTIGQAIQRHDTSLERIPTGVSRGPVTLGWISLGRDASLEQELLRSIQARIGNSCEITRLPAANSLQ